MKLFRRSTVEPHAREVRDEWLEWMRLSGLRPDTIKGYRLTTNKMLARYPELALSEFNDEHIIGLIEEGNHVGFMLRHRDFRTAAAKDRHGTGALSGACATEDSAHPPRRDGSGCARAEANAEAGESRPAPESALALGCCPYWGGQGHVWGMVWDSWRRAVYCCACGKVWVRHGH